MNRLRKWIFDKRIARIERMVRKESPPETTDRAIWFKCMMRSIQRLSFHESESEHFFNLYIESVITETIDLLKDSHENYYFFPRNCS